MSSLTLLAHEASKPPPFNGLLDGTIAAVIPVLFLAIAVQGKAYEGLLSGSVNAFARAVKTADKDEGSWASAGTILLFFGAVAAAVGIVVVAAVGEIQALIALDAKQAESWPLPATIILTVTVVVVVPGAILIRSVHAFWWIAGEDEREFEAKYAAYSAESARLAEESKVLQARIDALAAADTADPKEPGTPPAGPETPQPSEPDTPQPEK